LVVAVLVLLWMPSTMLAQQVTSTWDVSTPRGKTREIDFTTNEGTWMSVDISPDGRWIAFDLLAHIYRVPAEGGQAECLTKDSGVALNFHPRYSPDGRYIAFVSDRNGQDNLWIMEADGSNPRPVFTDKSVRVVEPTWTPDGQYIIVRRQQTSQRGVFEMDRLWMYHRDGGDGVELLRFDRNGGGWPSVSLDGRYLYFHVCTKAGPRSNFGCADVIEGGSQLRRLELKTGEIVNVTSGRGGAVAPEVSPDGRWLAFARRIPDGTISYKGHKFGPRSALWLRNLETGAERVIMDPIEPDLAERQHDVRPVFFLVRILPGFSWAHDGKSVVLSQGGKIRRLWLGTGEVETVSFTARVQRTISEMAYSRLEISDDPLEVRAIRWPAASPNGRQLVFQAVGKLWIVDLPEGTPRRLTSSSFQPFEFSPAWSSDGQWIIFTSWDETERGHIWKVAASGGTPQRLTQQAGEYIHPVLSPDGGSIVVARGSGSTARGGTLSESLAYELVRVFLGGGAAELVARVNPPLGRGQIVRPSFGAGGRIFYPEQKMETTEGRQEVFSELVSVQMSGNDKRVHLEFPNADEMVVSPDGRWVAFQEGDNIYLTSLPQTGTGATLTRVDKKKGKIPVMQLSTAGGNFPRWRNAATLEFGSANRYFAYNIDTKKIQSTEIHLRVPRALPKGIIALSGARIITLDNRKVIEKATIIVKGSRITCVGNCDASGADRVIDVSGKTIIPGFVDMHSHHYREYVGLIPAHGFENAVYLAYGFTTTLDPSAWSQAVFSTAELIEVGAAVGPRTFSTGEALYAGDGPRRNEISSYDVAEKTVERLASWGAVALKQYLQPRREQRQWFVDVARRKGLRVTAEANDHEYNLGMIMDGHTGFEHPLPYALLYSDVAKFMGRAGIVYSPTFVVGGPGAWNEDYFFQETDVWKDVKQRSWLPWKQLVAHSRRRMLRPATDYSFPLLAQGLADIIAEGGYGAVGGHGEQHGIGSHWEVWMAASALGPMGALEVASLHGAHFLGVEKDLGSLAVGKLADLMVLNSNPLDNIRNTTDIQYVMKGGVLYDAATLDEIWPLSKPFGPHYWVNEEVLRSDDRPVNYWDKPPRK